MKFLLVPCVFFMVFVSAPLFVLMYGDPSSSLLWKISPDQRLEARQLVEQLKVCLDMSAHTHTSQENARASLANAKP